MSKDMPDAPTLLAGRYRLGAELGRGGMGQVWLARDETLERDVAVKLLDLPEELAEGDATRRTLREARASARLSHPSVVQVYDVLSLDDRAWIVMEYVPSRSLREVIESDGPLDAYRAARIGLDLLAALEAAHRAGVQHRDVKPANVLLADDGRVLLTDFGIAAIDDDSLTSRSDVLLGSPLYMAPERARYGVSGPPADLWGLGATLYAAVEGHSPFQRASTMATLAALATEEPDPPQHAGPLTPVLDGLLRKDPDERIVAAEAERLLQRAVADLERSRSVPKPRTPVDDTVQQATDGVRGNRILLVGALIVVLLAGFAVFWFNRPSPRTTTGPAPATTAAIAVAGAEPSAAGSAGVTPSVSVSPSLSGGPSVSPSPANGRPPLPAGWKVYDDATGFSVYVPEGWTTSKSSGSSMRYWRDGKGHVLGIDQTDHPRSDPVADWKSQRDTRLRGGDFPGYDEKKLESVSYFVKAADWEWTFRKNGVQHVNNRGVVTSAHHAYGFWFQTPDADWAKYEKDVLEVVFKSFIPAKD
ncbi:serine/threonine protein kinase [Actinoplanes sp. SE50]|nr:Calcium/calmodulin-dependent protein kinase type II beta chain [Actinoplanes sp. SE50/110]ATO81747.1 serine/threonine protein kinase [Actinoplanes sp. SE50]SLL99155.1 serine/threonine protein kinase [Actinoplanes sp. SE50/110]